MDHLEKIIAVVEEISKEREPLERAQKEVRELYGRANEIRQDEDLKNSVAGMTELKTLQSCREPLEARVEKLKQEFKLQTKVKLGSVKQDRTNYINQQIEASEELPKKEAAYKNALMDLLEKYDDYKKCFYEVQNDAYEEVKETGYYDYAVESDYVNNASYFGFPTLQHQLDGAIPRLTKILDTFEISE